jgi:hypothetical protein
MVRFFADFAHFFTHRVTSSRPVGKSEKSRKSARRRFISFKFAIKNQA